MDAFVTVSLVDSILNKLRKLIDTAVVAILRAIPLLPSLVKADHVYIIVSVRRSRDPMLPQSSLNKREEDAIDGDKERKRFG